MRKNDLRTKKQVIKAISVGLSAAMMMQPVAALADELDAGIPLDGEAPAEQPEVSAADEAVTSENLDAIDKAIKEVDEAIDAEVKAYEKASEVIIDGKRISIDDAAFNEAVAVIGLEEDNNIGVFEGFDRHWRPVYVDIDDSAREFEDNAAKHVKDAQEILEDGAKALTGDPKAENEEDKTGKLDEFEDAVEAFDANVADVAMAAAEASSNNMKAEDALANANRASSSSTASVYAEEAGQAAEDASANNADAQKAADAAVENYEAAKNAYEEAKKIAEDANKAADKAVEAGLADAEKALRDAEDANKKAEALKKNLEDARAQASRYVTIDEVLLKKAEDTIAVLDEKLDELAGDKTAAVDEVNAAKNVQKSAQDAYDAAKKAKDEAPSDWDIRGLQNKVNGLEAALWKAEWALHDANENLKGATHQVDLAEEAMEAAQTAYDAIKEAYEAAKANLSKAQEAVTNLESTEKELTETYGENIVSELDALRNAEDKEVAAKTVIETVGGVSDVAKFEWDGFANGIFQGNDANGDVKYFTYAIDEYGTVSVINVTEAVIGTVTEKAKATVEGNLTEEEKDKLVASLEAGTFFTEMEEVAGEQTYTVTYTETTAKERGHEHKDKIGECGTYKHDNGRGTKTYYVEYDYSLGGGKYWYYTDDYSIVDGKYVVAKDADWHILDRNNYHKITLIVQEEKNVYGVTTDGLSQYENKTGYNCEAEDPVTSTVYKVTSGVVSKEVTESQLKDISENDILKKELVSAPLDALYSIDIEGGNRVSDIMYYSAPTYDEEGKKEYDYQFNVYGGYRNQTLKEHYSTEEGTLRWATYGNSNAGRWQYLYSNRWYDVSNRAQNISRYTKGEHLTNISQSELDSTYANYKDFAKREQEAQEAVYRVYVNGTTTTDVYGYKTGNSNDFSEITNALSNAKSALEGLNTTISDGDTKLGNLNDAIKRLDASNAKLKMAQAAYDAISGNNASLKAEKIVAEKALQDAKKDKAEAEKAYKDAKKALDDAKKDTDKAQKELGKIKREISDTELSKWVAENNKKDIEKALAAAEKEVAAWTEKIDRATELAKKTKEAREQAEEARNAIKNITASNLGAEALAKAEAELNAAEEALKEAQGLAEQALKDAENAQKAYEAAVQRVNDLIDEEYRRAEEERRDREDRERREREEAERLAEEERLAAEAALLAAQAAQAVPGQAVAAAPAAVAEEVEAPEVEEVAEVEIEDEETALADAPEVEEAEIADEETPLASMEEQAKMSWWWILIVLALGTTGAELYRRHMVKKNAEKVEK